MKIRKANLGDIGKINEIFSQGLVQELTLHHKKRNIKKIKEDFEYDFDYHKKSIKKNLKENNQYWIVGEVGKEIIGFGSAFITKDKKGEIESVYVIKQMQNKGYGTTILKELLRWLNSKKIKKIETCIMSNNIPSIKLHSKMGFNPYVIRMRLK